MREAVPALGLENRLAAYYIAIGLLALAVGGLMGLLQALQHSGINLYPYLYPVLASYYHGLTYHGVLMVLVWTTFFISGFLIFVATHSFGRPLASPSLGKFTFGLMVVGLLLAVWPIATNDATVLFTFYPPMRAHPAFYIGLTMVVVGTWLILLNLVLTYRQWRAENPGVRTPLPAFMAVVTLAMWFIASLGVALEMLAILIPFSLGLTSGADPLLARTLFWFTGHPIVYFWLLPAYISWYTMIPKQAGGKLFSDPLARVSFLLFLFLSTPVGLHHQFTDPGVGELWKFLQAIFTFGVFFPSLLTFFNVVASMELGGRARGGRGWLGWIPRLPWSDPSFTAQALGMVLFAFGGIGGLVNASYNVNLVVHNTMWVVGHFHLTVGSGVTLTFMGILYWLVPYLTGRALWSRPLGLVQPWLWLVGMGLMSFAQHWLGLLDMPRRTMVGSAAYLPLRPDWQALLPLVGIGGVILFTSGLLFFVNIVMTWAAGRRPARVEVPVAEALHGPETGPVVLDRWRPWLTVALALIIFAYGPVLAMLVASAAFNVPGVRVW